MDRKFSRAAISCLLTLLACNSAYAIEGDQNIDLDVCSGTVPKVTWAGTVLGPIPTPINLLNSGGSIDWDPTSFSAGCGQTSPPSTDPVTGKCLPNGIPVETTGQVTLTAPFGTSATSQVTFAGAITFASPGTSTFGLHVKKSSRTTLCDRDFELRINATGGGWGDPHLTTVDGVHYDFQSAGEFTALREPGLEIQTRQAAVSSTSGGLTNDYTGLTTCVAVYSALAARLGSSRVTLQPSFTGKPSDPLELRVDGKLVTLTPRGIDLVSGEPGSKSNGRIMPVGNNIEVTDAHGTRLVVTPAFWAGHNLWYLNINVFDTTAREGTMGMLAPESWLPALPDGSSLGGKPDSLSDRYEALYEKFADAWRVTDATSLFDYAEGTKTADFTLDEWPRNNPESCALEGQTPVEPADQATAEAACATIANPIHKADCIFDVRVTGEPGFAESYDAMKDLRPGPTGWQTGSGGGTEPPPQPPWWKTWWWLILLILLLLIIVWRVSKKRTP